MTSEDNTAHESVVSGPRTGERKNAAELAKAEAQMSIHFNGLSDDDAKYLELWDTDHTGSLSVAKLIEVVKKEKQREVALMRNNKMLQHVIVVLTVAIAILTGLTFAMCFMAIEVSKESHVQADGRLVNTDGGTVAVGQVRKKIGLLDLIYATNEDLVKTDRATVTTVSNEDFIVTVDHVSRMPGRVTLYGASNVKVEITSDGATLVKPDGNRHELLTGRRLLGVTADGVYVKDTTWYEQYQIGNQKLDHETLPTFFFTRKLHLKNTVPANAVRYRALDIIGCLNKCDSEWKGCIGFSVVLLEKRPTDTFYLNDKADCFWVTAFTADCEESKSSAKVVNLFYAKEPTCLRSEYQRPVLSFGSRFEAESNVMPQGGDALDQLLISQGDDAIDQLPTISVGNDGTMSEDGGVVSQIQTPAPAPAISVSGIEQDTYAIEDNETNAIEDNETNATEE